MRRPRVVGPSAAVLASLAAGVLALACGTESGTTGDSGGEDAATSAATSTATPGIPTGQLRTPTPERSAEEQDRIDGYAIRLTLPDVDLSNRTVPLRELESGGVGADSGIPSIHNPAFESVERAADWIGSREPVIALEVGGEARIYPIQILIWHEVVNDELGGQPVLVTFCPLCYTAIVFDRRVDGDVRDFGVSGLLRESDLVLYDYQTTTLWQQLTGEAIVGTDAGERLRLLPAQLVAFEDARAQYPDALVLSRETGFSRSYGSNPYAGYDDIDSIPIFTTSFVSGGLLPAKAQVLTFEVEDQAVAIPFDRLSQEVVVETSVGGVPVVALWQHGTNAALEAGAVRDGRDIGSAGAFRADVDGVPVRFEARDGAIFDTGTGSRWNVLGTAVEGPLAGTRLEPLVSGTHFWFIWAVFKPDTVVLVE
ncbi:MAG: DUF3179 domain-containing protein [Dehalococcoidia bacterium]